jgi:hypothetical protein
MRRLGGVMASVFGWLVFVLMLLGFMIWMSCRIATRAILGGAK